MAFIRETCSALSHRKTFIYAYQIWKEIKCIFKIKWHFWKLKCFILIALNECFHRNFCTQIAKDHVTIAQIYYIIRLCYFGFAPDIHDGFAFSFYLNRKTKIQLKVENLFGLLAKFFGLQCVSQTPHFCHVPIQSRFINSWIAFRKVFDLHCV